MKARMVGLCAKSVKGLSVSRPNSSAFQCPLFYTAVDAFQYQYIASSYHPEISHEMQRPGRELVKLLVTIEFPFGRLETNFRRSWHIWGVGSFSCTHHGPHRVCTSACGLFRNTLSHPSPSPGSIPFLHNIILASGPFTQHSISAGHIESHTTTHG